MRNEAVAPATRRRVRRSPGDRLRTAVLGLAGKGAQLARHSEKGWASITFAGTRHTFELVFDTDVIGAGEAFVAALPDHEFAIPGQLVADATVAAAETTLLPQPRLAVTCELLLLEEG